MVCIEQMMSRNRNYYDFNHRARPENKYWQVQSIPSADRFLLDCGSNLTLRMTGSSGRQWSKAHASTLREKCNSLPCQVAATLNLTSKIFNTFSSAATVLAPETSWNENLNKLELVQNHSKSHR